MDIFLLKQQVLIFITPFFMWIKQTKYHVIIRFRSRWTLFVQVLHCHVHNTTVFPVSVLCYAKRLLAVNSYLMNKHESGIDLLI